MSLKPGTAVGPYEIVAPLGAGGMGEVYRGFDKKLNRPVAVKILSADLASSAEHLRRFEQEARAASALNHPNIISIYDIGRSEGLAYIVMELVDGRDLRTLSAEDTLSLKQILRIASKVADGLAAAHERGIVHRDLKPENIMISADGFVKILDFGLAKLVAPWGTEDTTLPHTTPGAVFGTVGYMSPEQAAGRPTDFHADQFSLAVILYELITRKRPFDRATSPETMAAIIREQAEPLSALAPAAPPQLERIIARCLEKNPRERYGSTRDLARDLREVRDSLTTPTHPGRRSSVPRPLAVRRVSPVASIIAGVVLLAGIGYVGWQNYKSPKPRQVSSLAVLPFKDLNGTPDGQLLADGIGETIGSRLTQANAMRVASVLDGARGTLAEIADQYRADLLLRGSVQRSGDQVRVSYSILQPDGSEVAADSVTGAAAQLFNLEDMIAERVLQMMRVPNSARQKPAVKSGLDRADDQAAYIEAAGLVSRAKDPKSIDLAITKLGSLLGDARDSGMVNGTLARALMTKYLMRGDPRVLGEAALYAERAVQLDPTSVEGWIALGGYRTTTGKFADALDCYNRALALQSNSAEAFLGLGALYDSWGRAGDAEAAFERAIALRPDQPTAYNRYGGFCLHRGRYQKAAKLYERVIELTPDDYRGYVNLGAVYQSLGRYDDAVRSFERSIAASPNQWAYSNIGTLRASQGRYAEACTALEKATQLAPKDFTIWMNLGDLYRWAPGRRGDAPGAYGTAIAAARAALAVNPNNAPARSTIALSMAKTGNLDGAAAEMHEALKINPTDKDVLYKSAIVAQLSGDSDGALLWLQKAVEAGYTATELSTDPELTSLRNRPEFQKLIQDAKKKS